LDEYARNGTDYDAFAIQVLAPSWNNRRQCSSYPTINFCTVAPSCRNR
jgi:hypothetical protein